MSNRPMRNKFAREIIEVVTAAGGTVTVTAKGHLKITGPVGTAVVSYSGNSRRRARDTMALIRKHAGLDVAIKL